MTHDELLAKLEENFDGCGKACATCTRENAPWFALCAVVELHKPISYPSTSGLPIECTVCKAGPYYSSNVPYPCPTIQAIEKELG